MRRFVILTLFGLLGTTIAACSIDGTNKVSDSGGIEVDSPLTNQVDLQISNGTDLNTVLEEAPGVVLVDFYADWCGPCRRQAKVLNEVKGVADDNMATILKINVDEFSQIAKAYDVESLPTLVVIKNGQVIERRVGLANKEMIVDYLTR